MKKATTHPSISDEKNVCPVCRGTGFRTWYDDDRNLMAEECNCHMIQKQREQGILRFANIPSMYANLTFSDFNLDYYTKEDKNTAENDLKVCQMYVEHFTKTNTKGLYLFSNVKGTGKTRMVSIMANEMLSRNHNVKFATSGQILEEIKRSWDNNTHDSESKLMTDLASIDLLIIDDFGVESAKDWRNEKFYSIINGRYMAGKPIVYTSNYSLEDLQKVGYDERIISRIKETCYQIPFARQSVRDIKAEETQMTIKNWLR